MREAQSPSEIMNLTEAAKFIRVSEKTLGDLARGEEDSCSEGGREWRFLKQALEDWLSCQLDSKSGSLQDPKVEGVSRALIGEPAVQYQLPFAGFRDTAFTENRQRALHRWVPWIAGFSSSFVDGVLDKVSNGGPGRMTVIDPFAGVGTTLVEAMKKGGMTR